MKTLKLQWIRNFTMNKKFITLSVIFIINSVSQLIIASEYSYENRDASAAAHKDIRRKKSTFIACCNVSSDENNNFATCDCSREQPLQSALNVICYIPKYIGVIACFPCLESYLKHEVHKKDITVVPTPIKMENIEIRK